jgi:ParB family chromosome partitioning protein
MTELMQVQSLALSDILVDDEWNCRGKISPIDVADLATDIDARGLLQPVIVAPHNQDGYKYKLIAGYCRTFAHRILNKSHIQAVVRDDLVDEVEARIINLSENIQRKQLNIVQEAHALGRFIDLKMTETEISERLGMSRGWVQVRLMLLKVPERIQKNVAAGLITQKQIRHLYTLYKRSKITGNEEQLYDAVKKIKDARERGKTLDVNPNKRHLSSKRHRKRGELFQMMDHLLDTVGPGLHTKALAWAAGEINTYDFYDSVEDLAHELGIDYTKPRIKRQ